MMTFTLDLDYEGKPFSVTATVTKGSPERRATYNLKTANLIDPGEPADPGEIDYDLVWFKSVQSIVRLVYPEKAMRPYLEGKPYQDFITTESAILNEEIVDAIYNHVNQEI